MKAQKKYHVINLTEEMKAFYHKHLKDQRKKARNSLHCGGTTYDHEYAQSTFWIVTGYITEINLHIQHISTKIPMVFFTETEKNNPKSYMETKRHPNSQIHPDL